MSFKVNGTTMEGLQNQTRNINFMLITSLVSYKTTNNKIIEQEYCLYIRENLCDTIYHYIISNKEL